MTRLLKKKDVFKFALGAVDMTTQTIFKRFEMEKMDYLKKESEEEFESKTKKINFKDPNMTPEDNLAVSDNVNVGFFMIFFTVSKGFSTYF